MSSSRRAKIALTAKERDLAGRIILERFNYLARPWYQRLMPYRPSRQLRGEIREAAERVRNTKPVEPMRVAHASSNRP